MAKVIPFHEKKLKSTPPHTMSCSREGNWIIWRCLECDRKFKTNISTQKSVVERSGNFYARHIYPTYQPTKEEMKASGLPEAGFDLDLTFH